MGSKVVGASIRFWVVVSVGEDSVGKLGEAIRDSK